MLRIRRSGELGRDVLSLLIRAHENGEGISDEQLARTGKVAMARGMQGSGGAKKNPGERAA